VSPLPPGKQAPPAPTRGATQHTGTHTGPAGGCCLSWSSHRGRRGLLLVDLGRRMLTGRDNSHATLRSGHRGVRAPGTDPLHSARFANPAGFPLGRKEDAAMTQQLKERLQAVQVTEPRRGGRLAGVRPALGAGRRPPTTPPWTRACRRHPARDRCQRRRLGAHPQGHQQGRPHGLPDGGANNCPAASRTGCSTPASWSALGRRVAHPGQLRGARPVGLPLRAVRQAPGRRRTAGLRAS